MKKSKKKLVTIILILIILLGSIILPKSSIAAGNTVELYGTHSFHSLLSRNGMNINCIYTVYKKDGVEYPAYCLNLDLGGATETSSYFVNIDGEITDMEIWRTVINGYPYKTPEELGCANKDEAFLATKQAVYCALYDRDPNSYGALGGEAGERTLNALKQIVNNARTSTETKQSATLNIHANNSKWEIDKIDNNYVSKEFNITALAGIKEYTINLTGDLIEGTKVTDTQNVEKNIFESTEKFKILIPITNIEKDGTFSINVNGQVATKPVYFGKSTDPTLQNNAITCGIYEDGTGAKTEYYFKNESKIVILKQNQTTKEPLAGVKFQILDENKNVIHSNLTTDETGIVTVENLLPGKYYVQEIESLEGYQAYDKLIEVNVKLNEEVKITVNNLHNEDIQKTEKTNTEIEVEQSKSQIEIEQNNTKITSNEKEIKLAENNTEIKQENTKQTVEQNNIEVKLPKTGM